MCKRYVRIDSRIKMKPKQDKAKEIHNKKKSQSNYIKLKMYIYIVKLKAKKIKAIRKKTIYLWCKKQHNQNDGGFHFRNYSGQKKVPQHFISTKRNEL